MKKKILALGICTFALALGLVACDDSTSANGSSGDENSAEVSSSSVIPSTGSGQALSGGSAEVEGSSSSVVSSSSVESSSSVVSSSSEKSSSSVASSSSSAVSSSSVASSSSVVSSSSSSVILSGGSAGVEGSSSSKANWAYLNPDKTYGTMTDSRDGQVYKTIEICDKENKNCQTWMAENLNYRYVGVKFNYDGYTSDSTSWCGGGSGTTAGDCSIYGRLYTWAAAVDSVAIYKEYGEECGYGNKSCTRFSASALATAPVRGVCPSGWHLPSDAEWSALYTNVGGTDYAGQKLKANTSLWRSDTGTDEYGFSVLPAGLRYCDGEFYEGYDAYFWSSTEDEDLSYGAWSQRFDYDDYVGQIDNGKDVGFSVRCLKD